MAFPTIAVRIAFDSQPLASGSWVLGRSELGIDTRLGFYDAAAWDDVYAENMMARIKRGRQHDLQRIEAGTLQARNLNLSEDYWPDNPGGAYYPDVLPAKRINVQAVWDGITYDVYYGYIERWLPQFLSKGGLAPAVDIHAADVYKFLSQLLLNDAGGYAQELSGTRIDNLLDDMGMPAAQRDLDAGQTTLIATGALANINAMGHLHLVQDSEMGVVFQAPGGDVVFQDRHARLTSPLRDAQAMFGYGTPLDVGPGATDRDSNIGSAFTIIDKDNPVNADGVITHVSIWANSNLTGVKVGMFYNVAGTMFSCRSWDTIGNVAAGSKQTFEVSLTCETGDFLGIYWTAGNIERSSAAGVGTWFLAGDQIPSYGATFALIAPRAISIEGEGRISKIHDLTLEMGDSLIFNDVRMTRDGGTEQTAADGMSGQDYGYRSYSKTGLLMTTDGVALDMATWILQRQKDPNMIVKSIVIRPQVAPDDLWPKVLGYDLGTKIYIKHDGAFLDEAYHIEGIQHIIRPQFWEAKWWLSPAATEEYWILGISELGITTRLGF